MNSCNLDMYIDILLYYVCVKSVVFYFTLNLILQSHSVIISTKRLRNF